MVCKHCGTMLPDDALFCGDCGKPVEKDDKSKVIDVYGTKGTVKWFKVAVALLAVACVVLLAGLVMALRGDLNFNGVSPKPAATQNIENGMELSGVYIVGEDEELPEGRYNIYPVDGEEYFSVYIFESKEAYEKEDKDGYKTDYMESFFDEQVKGFKLKEGYVVEIKNYGAIFEKAD